ncbi:putative RNA methyltransferase [Fusobacterium sp. MFO224]|uniref:putative RNA methyltransferase n=1 Tax=Fusobacterium sp. MFO224 TaxID=3378070 RepID=UPI003855372D
MIICPKCKEKLYKDNKTYKCINNHSFDIAKSGYVNLLLDNQKNSKNPGDDKDMVKSRKFFLEKGYYKDISHKLNEIIGNDIKSEKDTFILDIGCGEGYYTGNLKEYLDATGKKNKILGIDISKQAIIEASKKYKKIDWVIASALNIPLMEETCDFVICMFSKIIPEEKNRVLKKGGKVIIVSTGENHLQEIKEVVYKNVKKDYYSPIDDMKEFKHIETINVKSKISIEEKENIENLFNMTPYRWRSPKDGVKKLFNLESIKVTIDVNFDIFEKN